MVRIQYTVAAIAAPRGSGSAVVHEPGAEQELLHADDRDERRVLDHRDELIADRRNDDPNSLGQHDPRITRGSGMPSASAASRWPRATAWMPARKISVM